MNNYKQYLEWEKEDKDLALDRLRRCVQDALKEDLRVTDTDDRKGMLSTPGRGPSVYETAAVYSEIFRRARAARAVAPLAVYSAAKYDETMTAARKRASSAYDYLPERVPGQTPGMSRPLRTVCGEQGVIPEDETGVRRERPKPILP